jgi:putative membrane protein
MEIFLLILQSVKSGLPFLISHFFTAVVIFVSGLWVYTKVTPMNELDLIKDGNIAASLSFAGACVGISIPLAVCLSSSVNIADIIVWGSIAVILQLICFKVVDFFLKDLSARIIDGEIGISIVLVGFKLSIAVLNAAAVAG